LLGAARAARIPVLHTNLSYDANGRNGGVFFRKVGALRSFARNSEHPQWGEFAAGLEPLDGEIVITKQYASAFFGTTLAPTLTSMGVDTLLIAGVSTSGCVRATAVDCCQYGFIPLVVRDAVGDRAEGPHDASLFDLQAKYAEVVGLSEAANYLSKFGLRHRLA
jgi:nicotinamidase-related amidase